MQSPKLCPTCKMTLPVETAAGGVCPICAFRLALDAQAERPADDAGRAATLPE